MSGVGNSSPLVRKDHDSVENEKDIKKLKTDPKEFTDRFYFEIWCKMHGAKYPSEDPEVEERAFSAFQANLEYVPSEIQKMNPHLYDIPSLADRFPEDIQLVRRNAYASVSKVELREFFYSDAYAKADDTCDPTPPELSPTELFAMWCEDMGVEIPTEDEKQRAFDHFQTHLKRRIAYCGFQPWSWESNIFQRGGTKGGIRSPPDPRFS